VRPRNGVPSPKSALSSHWDAAKYAAWSLPYSRTSASASACTSRDSCRRRRNLPRASDKVPMGATSAVIAANSLDPHKVPTKCTLPHITCARATKKAPRLTPAGALWAREYSDLWAFR
jgi:hypothetical protein